jgi:hypothetical protein
MGPTKDSVENKVNLAKLSLEELEELYERQNNILKNKYSMAIVFKILNLYSFLL